MGALRKMQALKEPCLRESSKLRRLVEEMSLLSKISIGWKKQDKRVF